VINQFPASDARNVSVDATDGPEALPQTYQVIMPFPLPIPNFLKVLTNIFSADRSRVLYEVELSLAVLRIQRISSKMLNHW
jgi:hypothetical protein